MLGTKLDVGTCSWELVASWGGAASIRWLYSHLHLLVILDMWGAEPGLSTRHGIVVGSRREARHLQPQLRVGMRGLARKGSGRSGKGKELRAQALSHKEVQR